MVNFRFGIEIETLLNTNLFTIERGSYHDGVRIPGLPSWTSESDSSIYTNDIFGQWTRGFEFVSNCCSSRRRFTKIMNDFINFFSKNGELELNEVMSFPKSCGGHIHISLPIRNFRFGGKIPFEIFKKTRKLFFEKLSNSNVDPETKRQITVNYNRHYAKIPSKKAFYDRDRQREFNLTSESNGKGLEWRSINFVGIKTWKELSEVINIALDCLEFLYKKGMRYNRRNSSIIKVEEEDTNEETTTHIIINEDKDETIEININQNREETRADLERFAEGEREAYREAYRARLRRDCREDEEDED